MAFVDKTKLGTVGNSAGVTLKKDVLAEAGMARGDDVRVEAENGRIVITRADDAYDETLALGRESFQRYPNAYKALAK